MGAPAHGPSGTVRRRVRTAVALVAAAVVVPGAGACGDDAARALADLRAAGDEASASLREPAAEVLADMTAKAAPWPKD